jgi:hypothetical protein
MKETMGEKKGTAICDRWKALRPVRPGTRGETLSYASTVRSKLIRQGVESKRHPVSEVNVDNQLIIRRGGGTSSDRLGEK